MKRHQIKMLQTEVGLDKRKEVGLAGLFFWHQLVHYYSALMAHFSTGVDRPKIPEGRCPVLSEEQIRRLLEECRRGTTKLLYPFVLLALHTGCRSMELRG